MGEQLLTLAQRTEDSGLALTAQIAMGTTLCYCGEWQTARTYLEQAWALYVPQEHLALASLYGGNDPGVPCLCYTALTLWMAGYPAQAVERSQAALTLARETEQPYSLAYALNFAAVLFHFRREAPTVQVYADELLALARGQDFRIWQATGTAFQGWVRTMQGHTTEGLLYLREGLDALTAARSELAQPYWGSMLVEAYGRAGQVADGLAVAAALLRRVQQTGEHFYEPELYRLQGELQRHPDARVPPDAAEASFQQMLAIARSGGAKSMELRAALHLSRLWQHQGRRQEASDLLAPIYDWFTEGFDTADLQEAKALLEELRGARRITRAGPPHR